MKTSVNVLSKLVLLISLMGVLFLSNCTSILTAKFESDSIGGNPNKTLPGSPSGDEISYISEIENQLKIVVTPSYPSQKSLEILNVAPSGSTSGHSDWLSFRGKSTNFTKPITFTWTGVQNFSSNTPYLLVDVSDGSGTVAARIKFEGDGDMILVNDIVTGNGSKITEINDGERYTVMLTVMLAQGKYNINISKPSGSETINDRPLLTSDITSFHNPAHPTVSFKFGGSTSSNNFIADEVFIRRKK